MGKQQMRAAGVLVLQPARHCVAHTLERMLLLQHRSVALTPTVCSVANAVRSDKHFWLSFYGLPDNERLRALRSSRIGKLSQFVGTVTRTTDVRPELFSGTFRCMECMTGALPSCPRMRACLLPLPWGRACCRHKQLDGVHGFEACIGLALPLWQSAHACAAAAAAQILASTVQVVFWDSSDFQTRACLRCQTP